MRSNNVLGQIAVDLVNKDRAEREVTRLPDSDNWHPNLGVRCAFWDFYWEGVSHVGTLSRIDDVIGCYDERGEHHIHAALIMSAAEEKENPRYFKQRGFCNDYF